VILERPNGAFSGVAAMGARWDKLVVNVFVAQKRLESGRTLVVEASKFWV
jgi:hypothetical protein